MAPRYDNRLGILRPRPMMGDMLWFTRSAALVTGVLVAALAPAPAQASGAATALAVADETARAPRVGRFGLLGTLCCLAVVALVVLALLLASRGRRRR